MHATTKQRHAATWRAAGVLVPLALARCDLAPKYRSPVVSTPLSYAEAAQWQQATPLDTLPRGAWWRMYNDTTLDSLEARLDTGNPDLQAQAASYDQARALAAEAEAGLLPTLGIGGQITTNRQSNRRPLRGRNEPNQYMNNLIDTQATYEIDIWRKAANAVKAGQATAAAAADDIATLSLSLHAELATDYVTLRGLDSLHGLLQRTIEAYRQALVMTQNRFAGFIASGLDVARAQAQLEDAKAQDADILARREIALHAIAVLIGVPPAALALPPAPLAMPAPVFDAGAPATLLERRPDIAAAERLVFAANAEIGVARAAFYPNISLNAVLGLQDSGFNLFNMPDSFWTVGPGLTLPLFEGGLRKAEENAAIAVYRQTAANYKATVLRAFGEVEDQLGQLRWLGQEQQNEDATVRAARQTLSMAMALYKDGATNFLDVVVAQTAELQAERNELDLRTRRVAASVGLVRALGGGFEAASQTSPSPGPAGQRL